MINYLLKRYDICTRCKIYDISVWIDINGTSQYIDRREQIEITNSVQMRQEQKEFYENVYTSTKLYLIFAIMFYCINTFKNYIWFNLIILTLIAINGDIITQLEIKYYM